MDITTEEFNNIYVEFHKRLLAYTNKFVRDDNRSEEIVHEVFSKLLKQDFDKIKDHIMQWLFTVCRNTSIKFINKNKRYVYNATEDESLDESRNPSEELEFQEKLKLLKKCMRKLTPRQRQVLKCRFYKDLNYEQAAKKLKTSSTNIGFIQCTTLKELRSLLNKDLVK